MQLHVYRGEQLAAVFEYGKEPTYLGPLGEEVKHAVETPASAPPVPTPPAGVPGDWLMWAASVVYPVLAIGAFVRSYSVTG